MLTELAPDLLDRLDFPGAVQEEGAAPLTFLPSRVIETVITDRPDDATRILSSQLRARFALTVAETVWVPKPGKVGRYRPLTALPIRDRLLLRALDLDLRSILPRPDRSWRAQQEFQGKVLDQDVSHVVIADVASFYFFIDHDLLETRVVEATALPDTAAVLRQSLSAYFGRPYGLPQNFEPSLIPSDLFIAPVERRLLRRGIAVYRNNDDFRLGAHSWGDALQYLELLQEEVSSIGLDLNAEKSWILRSDKYRQNLGLSDQIFQQALQAVQAEGLVFDAYTGEPLNGDGDELEQGVEDLTRALELAFEAALERQRGVGANGQNPSAFEARANREIISAALFQFTRVESDAALEEGPRLVAIDPLFAAQYARYLRALTENAAGTATDARIQAVVGAFRGHVPPWTFVWLFNSLLRTDAVIGDESIRMLADFAVSSAASPLRARAALVLAHHNRLAPTTLTQLFDAASPAAAPDLAAAAACLSQHGAPQQELNALVDEQPLLRLISDYTRAQLPDVSWL